MVCGTRRPATGGYDQAFVVFMNEFFVDTRILEYKLSMYPRK
jgi:hypothetical protein